MCTRNILLPLKTFFSFNYIGGGNLKQYISIRFAKDIVMQHEQMVD